MLMLWIALKLVSLYYQTQLHVLISLLLAVVNCFKISIFVLSNTTSLFVKIILFLLWIALKLVSLYYQTQQIKKYPRNLQELWIALKLVSLYYQTQPYLWQMQTRTVVNCFKISIFVLSNTTWPRLTAFHPLLWIALKLVSLYYQTQPKLFNKYGIERCELL